MKGERVVELLSEMLKRNDQALDRLDQVTDRLDRLAGRVDRMGDLLVAQGLVQEKHSGLLEKVVVAIEKLTDKVGEQSELSRRVQRLEDKVFGA